MNEQMDNEGNHADNDRAKDGSLPPGDNEVNPNLLADPGGEPQQEGIDHQHEQANGEDDEGAGEQPEHWADKRIEQPHYHAHDGEGKDGGGTLHRHPSVWREHKIGDDQSDDCD